MADSAAYVLSTSIEKRQQLLETSDVATRLDMILDLMNAGQPAKLARRLHRLRLEDTARCSTGAVSAMLDVCVG